jgi:hypothetical protein
VLGVHEGVGSIIKSSHSGQGGKFGVGGRFGVDGKDGLDGWFGIDGKEGKAETSFIQNTNSIDVATIIPKYLLITNHFLFDY